LDIAAGLWSRPEVQQFWIYLPPQITRLNTSYCNASLLHTNPSLYRLPFPPTLDCVVYSNEYGLPRQHRVALTLLPYGPDGAAWPPDITDIVNFSVRVYL
jgi:hypothetical protein